MSKLPKLGFSTLLRRSPYVKAPQTWLFELGFASFPDPVRPSARRRGLLAMSLGQEEALATIAGGKGLPVQSPDENATC